MNDAKCTRCNQPIKPGDAVQRELPGMPQEQLCPKCWSVTSAERQAEADRIEAERNKPEPTSEQIREALGDAG